MSEIPAASMRRRVERVRVVSLIGAGAGRTAAEEEPPTPPRIARVRADCHLMSHHFVAFELGATDFDPRSRRDRLGVERVRESELQAAPRRSLTPGGASRRHVVPRGRSTRARSSRSCPAPRGDLGVRDVSQGRHRRPDDPRDDERFLLRLLACAKGDVAKATARHDAYWKARREFFGAEDRLLDEA